MRTVVPTPFPDPTVRDAADFGQAVRAARTLAGIRLEDAAQALGISKQTLTDIEKGTGTVAIGTALRVARDLGVALLACPLSTQFEAARALQEARQARPKSWGGESPDPNAPQRTAAPLRDRKVAT